MQKNHKMLTLGIRTCGDYTQKLATAKIGDLLKIRSYYGHFTQKHDRQPYIVEIDGDIGITPCLSLMQSLDRNAKVTLIW